MKNREFRNEVIRQYLKEEEGMDARELLEGINEFIQDGDPLPEIYREYFDQAIKATDLNKGFGIKRSRVTANHERLIDDCRIYDAVIESGLGLHKAEGGAYSVVGKQFNMSASAIEDACKRFKKADDEDEE